MVGKIALKIFTWLGRLFRSTGTELPVRPEPLPADGAASTGAGCDGDHVDGDTPTAEPEMPGNEAVTAEAEAEDPPDAGSHENAAPMPPPSPCAPAEDPLEDETEPADTPSEVSDELKTQTAKNGPAPRAPHDRPGQRTGASRHTEKGGASGASIMISRPDLICRSPKGSWQWEIALTWNDDCDLREVRQNGRPLEIDGRECRIASFRGSLSIEYSDRGPEQVALFEGKPLVFRLRKDWAGEGRRVRDVTKGYFIVIAPNDWRREGEIPVEEAGCVDEEFVAHYFFRGGSETPGQSDRLGEHEIGIANSGYELDGMYVFDDSDHGSLFVGNVPELHASEGIVWARVGEETANGWRGENFKPDECSLRDALKDRQGRFFVRVYDWEVSLVDSGEFRYLRDLREIRVDGEPYRENAVLMPPYLRTAVEFVGGSGVISPVLENSTHAEIDDSGKIIVAGQPDGDVVQCQLQVGGGSVDCVVKLPRIWWRMEWGSGESVKWRDTAIDLTRQEFREHARGGAAIMLRLPTRLKSVRVGFDDQADRLYRPNAGNETIEIPLLHFDDYSQIDRRLNADALFNIEYGETVLTLIRVAADPAPEIVCFTSEPAVVTTGETAVLRWETRNVEPQGVLIDPGIGRVEPCGSREISLLGTTAYTLKLTDPAFSDVTESATVFVDSPLQSGEIMTPTQLLAKIMKVQSGTFVEYFRGHLVVDQNYFPEVRTLHKATQILKEFELVTLVQGKVGAGKFIYYAVRIGSNFDKKIIKMLKNIKGSK